MNKTILIPKPMYDLMKPPMTYGETENLITLLSFIQDNKEQVLKTGKVEASFSLDEYAKRREEIRNGEYLVSIIDENGHCLTEDEIGIF